MKVGTKSVLFGAHCFVYHWLAVGFAWWKLYRWAPAFEGENRPAILDWRAWLVFFVHDIGYLGKPNMDGLEGECHPFTGARFVTWLLNPRGNFEDRQYIPAYGSEGGVWLCPWGMFTLLHSRHLAKALQDFPSTSWVQPSRLCAADKLALSFTPWWLYLPGVIASGEIKEYMAEARRRGAAVGITSKTRRAWYDSVRNYCARWAYEHADGREDTWTGARHRGEIDKPEYGAKVSRHG